VVPEFRLIETLSDLESLSKQLAGEEVLAVDIEADSLHHYFPKVCLVQISTDHYTFVIDPLAIQTMDVLQPLFTTDRIKKIFHGADYDLRSIFRDFAIKVNNVFDTMVASQFIGEKEVGLAAVLKKRFGIHLIKKYQRANWSKRPLSQDMLLYAAHDTAHLITLYRELELQLKSKGRLSWVIEEGKLLSLQCAMDVKANSAFRPADGQTCSSSPRQLRETPLFKRFKGAGKMTQRDLAILEGLLVFREGKAMQQDRPPFKLFGNQVINELVKTKPTEYSALMKTPRLPADFMRRYAKGVLGAIKSGLAMSEDCLPSYPRTPRAPRNPEKQARLKRLKNWRDKKARELEMESGLVCNNLLLDALAEGNPKDTDGLKAMPGMKIWQRETLGQEIVQVLRGATQS